MSEQKQFFIDSISYHFNLRNPKEEKPTPIYMVIRLDGKQYKYPLGCKVIPSQWDKRKERPFISPYISKLDNHNNFIIINEIALRKTWFFDAISYICNNGLTDLLEVKKVIDGRFKNIRSMARKRENALIELGNLIEAQRMGEDSKYGYQSELKCFTKFINEEKGKNILEWEEITLPLMKEYEKWLNTLKVKHKITHEMVSYEDNTIIGKKGKIYTILTYADSNGKIDLQKTNLYKFKGKEQKDHVEDNQIYLTEEEWDRIKSLNLSNELDNKVRDLFCFQCEVGQRYEDINELEPIIKENKIKIFQKKSKRTIYAPLTDLAKEILNRYNYKLPKINIQKANKALKEIAKLAGINHKERIVEMRGGNPYIYEVEAWQIVGTHTARRSFISNGLKTTDSNVLRKITGHSTDSAFNRYNRMSSEDAADVIINNQEEAKQTRPSSTPNATLQYMEEKVKEIFSLKNDNEKQQYLINQLEQALKEQKRIADTYKDYADVFTPEEYSDRITELAMDAEMEEAFTEHKRWGE